MCAASPSMAETAASAGEGDRPRRIRLSVSGLVVRAQAAYTVRDWNRSPGRRLCSGDSGSLRERATACRARLLPRCRRVARRGVACPWRTRQRRARGAAWRRGARFDGWSEHFDFSRWRARPQRLASTLGQPAFLTGASRSGDGGRRRLGAGFLADELDRSRAGELTPDCRDDPARLAASAAAVWRWRSCHDVVSAHLLSRRVRQLSVASRHDPGPAAQFRARRGHDRPVSRHAAEAVLSLPLPLPVGAAGHREIAIVEVVAAELASAAARRRPARRRAARSRTHGHRHRR